MAEPKFKEGDSVIAVYSCSGVVHKVPAVVTRVVPHDGAESFTYYRLDATVKGRTGYLGTLRETLLFANQRDADIAALQTKIEIELSRQEEHCRKMRKCGLRVASLQDKLDKLMKGR